MAHSVSRHLNLAIGDYDVLIRRFIPSYDRMLDLVVERIGAVSPRLVLDLGAGTGALAERLLAQVPDVTVELWDVDPAMLEVAGGRVARFGARARPVLRSYDETLPPCDGVMASLSLHHVPTLEAKGALFRRIADALRPGGCFANGDVTMAADPSDRAASFDRWAAHMATEGIDAGEARRHFADWAGEDVYLPADQELAAIAAAGLDPELVWRDDPVTVTAARKAS